MNSISVTPVMNLHVRLGDTEHLLSLDNAAILRDSLTAALAGLTQNENRPPSQSEILNALKQKAADASQSVEGEAFPPGA